MVGETWWIWMAAAVVLATMEVAIRLYVFLALALASLITGVMLWLRLGPAEWMQADVANSLAVCAGLSVVFWVGLRLGLGAPRGDPED